jgi:hypothetical protein
VTFYTFHNVYKYSAATLWYAYGSAISLALVFLGLGMVCLFLNNAAFTKDFSTILRAAKSTPMSEDMTEEDGEGRQPSPTHLAKARFLLRRPTEAMKSESSSSGLSEEPQVATAETGLLSADKRKTWHTL